MELTREQIENLPAGREMDALIAEIFEPQIPLVKVSEVRRDFDEIHCDWRYSECDHYSPLRYWVSNIGTDVSGDSFCEWSPANEYSTDIAAAWAIVEKLEEHPNEILSQATRKGKDHDGLLWYVWLRECRGYQHDWIASDKSLPIAICRAALLAALEIEQRKNG